MQNFIFSKLFLNSTTLLNLSQIWQKKHLDMIWKNLMNNQAPSVMSSLHSSLCQYPVKVMLNPGGNNLMNSLTLNGMSLLNTSVKLC